MAIVNRTLPPVFPEPEPITENFCCTNIKRIKCSLTWTINNFSCFIGDKGDSLMSSEFSADDDKELKWYLVVFPKGLDMDSLALRLKLESSARIQEVTAKLKFTLINVKKEANIVKEIQYAFEGDDDFEYEDYCYNNILGLEYLLNKENGFLPEDKLSIFCEICVTSDCEESSGKNPLCYIPKSQFAKDFGSTFETKLLSDVTLSVGDQKFKAHKVVLAARSPVFAAMFTHEMEEQNKNAVNILDVDRKVFEEMLLFIYTEKAPNLEKMAKELLTVADKYMLENLKIMCENELCQNLTIDTAAETLMLADLHNANQLKGQAIKFIYNNLTAVMNTSGFTNMIARQSSLAAEILQALGRDKKNVKTETYSI